MKISLISVPYDSGYKERRMGLGPSHFIRNGLVEKLQASGHDVTLTTVEAGDEMPLEAGTSFGIYRRLSVLVADACWEGRFPLVLAGNCGSCIGTVSGIDTSQSNSPATPPGIVWFDAHADFNTPDTTLSGFLDGMALAIRCGRCWTSLAATVPNFRPTPEQNVILVGVRDIDPAEGEHLARVGISVIPAEQVRSDGVAKALSPAIAALRERTGNIYLHLDLDVLDPAEAPANQFLPPDGLSIAHVEQAISLLSGAFTISAAAFTAYDPTYDPDGLTLRAGFLLADRLTGQQKGVRKCYS